MIWIRLQKYTVLVWGAFLASSAYGTCLVNSESHLPYRTEFCWKGTVQGAYDCVNSATNPIPKCYFAKGNEGPGCFTDYPSQEDIFASCSPNSSNSDLMWTPDQASRRKLFDTLEVQETPQGCESYGQLLKAECKPEFPVLTIYYDSNNRFKVESFAIERDIYLNSSTELSPSIKSYLQTRIKIPSGNWSSQSFLMSTFLPTGDSGFQMTIFDYVKIVNAVSNKYPTMDYKQAYIDFINGEYQNLGYYRIAFNVVTKKAMDGVISIINSTLLDD